MNGGTEKEGDQLMFSFIDTKYDRTHIKIINSCEVERQIPVVFIIVLRYSYL